MRRAPAVLLILATWALPGEGFAQSSDAAAAETLFREGQSLRKEGKYDEACPKLAESYRLDPATGSLLALALCYEGQQRLASAWSAYVDAAARAKNDGESDREEAANERVAELEGRLSKITVEVSPKASDIEGLEVLRDGKVLAPASWSVPMPVDGGDHVIEARAPGHTPWEQTVLVEQEMDTQTVTVPALSALSPPAASEPAVPAVAPTRVTAEPTPVSAPPPRPLPQADRRPVPPHRALAVGLAATGVVGLGVGTYFGLKAFRKKNEAEDAGCNEQSECINWQGVETIQDGRTAGNISTAAFILGGALLAGGAAVYLLGEAPGAQASARSPALRLSPGLSSVAVHARF
jgi:serine/threonine-protein kinase